MQKGLCHPLDHNFHIDRLDRHKLDDSILLGLKSLVVG